MNAQPGMLRNGRLPVVQRIVLRERLGCVLVLMLPDPEELVTASGAPSGGKQVHLDIFLNNVDLNQKQSPFSPL